MIRVEAMQNKIYTIGHSNHGTDEFLFLLRKFGVNAVADVRSSPYSKYNKQFNKNELENSLAENNIAYVFLGEELGARPKEPEFYVDGKVDYSRLQKSENFKLGIERILKGVQKYSLAMMCAEKEPLDCHRTILVSRHLKNLGFEVSHILADGTVENHSETENRLIEISGHSPLPLLGNLEDDSNILADAYHAREKNISYRASR